MKVEMLLIQSGFHAMLIGGVLAMAGFLAGVIRSWL